MLEREFKYYKEHQLDLVRKFQGRFVVIVGDEVVGDFDSEIQAYLETKKTHEVGTFLIQLVQPGTESYTQTFHSRVTFAR